MKRKDENMAESRKDSLIRELIQSVRSKGKADPDTMDVTLELACIAPGGVVAVRVFPSGWGILLEKRQMKHTMESLQDAPVEIIEAVLLRVLPM